MEEGIGTAPRCTLNALLDSSRKRFSDLPAIGMAMEKPLTYSQFHTNILALATRFVQEGIKKGDRIAILAENSHNWGMAYFATLRSGGVAVPILPDLPESDVHHILNEMQVRIIFTSQRQIEKIYEFNSREKIQIITLDDYQSASTTWPLTPFSEFLATSFSAGDSSYRPHSFPEADEDDLAAILYTSGTSGYSKAVMLTQKNLAANALAASQLVRFSPGEVFLSILPMSHTYEFTTSFIVPLINGCRIAYAGKMPTPAILQKLCQHEQPTAIFAVPLIMEKIYKKRVLPQVERSTMLQIGCRYSFTRKLIYRAIAKKLLDFFGGKLRLMGIGGAALNPEVEQFLHEAEFPYLVGYGQTECSPLLAGGPLGDPGIAVGSTGKPVPGVEIRIASPDPQTGIGEIMARGPNVMKGYYDNPETTAQTLSPDGWIATGDLGCFDAKGNLYIKGRSKNMIVLSNGENVYPEAIEHKLNSFNWVVESLVFDNNGQLEAWVYPDYEMIDEATNGKTQAERREYIEHLFASGREKLNQQLAVSSRISRIFERREPFIKTATHKIKRYLYDGHAIVP